MAHARRREYRGDTSTAGAPLRAVVALSLALAAGIIALAAAAGLTGSIAAAIAIAVLAAAVTGAVLWRHPVIALERAACSRALLIVSGLAAIAALVQVARLAVFMVAPSQVAYSSIPWSAWETQHSCLSAYFVAARSVDETPSVYDDSLYSLPGDPSAPRQARMMDRFRVDPYEYPPPFLLLPRALRLVVPDFLGNRMLWFALNVGGILMATLVVARRLGPAAGTRALLLSPLLWAALPTASVLQKGNVQGLIIAMSVVAMVLFDRRRFAAGGALLAFATLSKLFPGVLLVYLLVRRQWRALAWTSAWSAAFLLVTLIDVGWSPFASFLDHLPGLVGGEAFPAFRQPRAIAINYSLPGLAFKLGLFGVPGMGFAVAKIIGWIYTLILVLVTVLAALREPREGREPLLWLTIALLATLRSPFLPQAYAAFPSLWLLVLLPAVVPGGRTLLLALLAWVALNAFIPVDSGLAPRLVAVISTLPQAVTVAVGAAALLVSWPRSGSLSPARLGLPPLVRPR
ncbi:MAG TPA: glycosyltransferase family 87 protein [Kofleriaceae bacterium]|nr:glycosyltransferase family 87 protein [Kofleriaceae bacterium]